MQKSSFIIILLIAGVLVSCSKSKSEKSGGDTIAGHWKLTETLMDPGDGSGTWQPYTGAPQYLSFNDDSTITTTNFNWLFDYDRYEIIDDHKVKLINSSNQTSVNTSYEIKLHKLTLTLFCIEPCGLRFARILNTD